MKKKPAVQRPTIIECLKDPDIFGPLGMDKPTWLAWRTIMAAAYGLPLRGKQLDLFKKLTGRSTYSPPRGGWRVIVVIAARQSGKTQVAGVVTAYESTFPLVEAPNLRAVLVAQSEDDVKQTLFRYARHPFDKSETLAANITSDTTTTLTLNTGVVVHALPCKPASVRGPSAVIAALDEPAHYRATSGDPLDAAIIEAVEPSLFTTKGKLWLLSSPYAEYGRLWELHRDFFGKDDPRVLVIQSDSLTLNPTLDAKDLEEFRRVNPDAAVSEVDGLFRANLSKLLDPAALQKCVLENHQHFDPQPGMNYLCFVDSASGGRTNLDRYAMAIAHVEGKKVRLDLVKWWTPPFSTKTVVSEIASLVAPYRIKKVYGDRHGKGYIGDAYKDDHKLIYEEVDSDHSMSENLLELEKMVNTEEVELLDLAEVLRELRILDRIRGSGGKDKVAAPRGAHDDIAAALAGAVRYARERGRRPGEAVVATFSKTWTPSLSNPRMDMSSIHPHERPVVVGPPEMSERKRRAWSGEETVPSQVKALIEAARVKDDNKIVVRSFPLR